MMCASVICVGLEHLKTFFSFAKPIMAAKKDMISCAAATTTALLVWGSRCYNASSLTPFTISSWVV